MSTISFSHAWTLRAVPWLFRFNVASDAASLSTAGLLSSGGSYDSGSPWAIGRIDIMKGTMPTSLVGLELLSARSSDVLASFVCPNGAPSGSMTQTFQAAGLSNNLGAGDGTNPQIINSIYKPAVASGVATWFRWMTVSQPTWDAEPTTIVHQIVGTVSTVDNGGDLQMESTTMTTGDQYRISSIRFFTPTAFTY